MGEVENTSEGGRENRLVRKKIQLSVGERTDE